MNITLTKEQLAQLIAFLEARKFKDPVVMAEVLHSLKDKIAQKLSADQSLNVDDAIHRVCQDMELEDISLRKEMHMPGYTPVPVMYEKVVKKKYKGVLRTELKNLVTNPLYLAIGIIITIGSYFMYRWGNEHAVVWDDINAASLLLFAAYLVTSFAVLGKIVDIKASSIQSGNDMSFVPITFVIISFQHTHLPGSTGLTVMSVLYALICGWFFFSSVARYRTLVAARKNSDEVYSFYGNKFPWLKAV